MSDRKVSVVIPTYNYARYLGSCIDSVLGQTHRALEIIVVDDGSTDDTQAVCERYRGKLACIRQENAGLPAARNTGISRASGEVIQLLDSDDQLHPRSIERRLETMQKLNASWTVGHSYYFSERPGGLLPDRLRSQWGLPSLDLDARLFAGNVAPPHAFLASRELYERVGGFDTGLAACEDYDYWLRALEAGFRLTYSPSGAVYYRRHPGSMSQDTSRQWVHDAKLHGKVRQILCGPAFAGLDDRGMLFRAYALQGVQLTFDRLADRNPELSRSLVPLCSAYMEELCAGFPRISPSPEGIKVLCITLEVIARARSAPGRSLILRVDELELAAEEVVRRIVNTASLRGYLSRYVFSRDANDKARLDHVRALRWLLKKRSASGAVRPG